MHAPHPHLGPEQIAQLQDRLVEMEETLHAIRTGQVDALVHGSDIYTLESAESASNRFRGEVLKQINDSVVAVDNEDRITYLNGSAERVYGVTSSDVLGLQLHVLYGLRWVDPMDERTSAAALEQHGVWRGENIHVKRNGQQVQVESVVTALRDSEGHRIGSLSVMRDITERVRDRAALQESDRQKDHFLATLAHELRNPLSPLMNGLQLLDDEEAEVRTLTRAMMQRQLDQLVRLVDDLMDVSRISRGKLELRKQQLDLRTVLTTAVESSKPLLDQRGHRLQQQVAPTPLLVNGDLTRLAQIVANLLNNAAKYTPPGGVIDVVLERDGEDALLSITDNGIGIERAAIGRIFDMFTQVDGTGKDSGGGLGIGLNIAQRLTAMHHGQLSAHSAGKDQGSAFVLRLPLMMAPQAVAPTNGASASLPSRPSLRIMVVDDNIDGANSLAMLLRRSGHEVHVAQDGLDALSAGSSFLPDVIFMDIGMPRMDGVEACAHMRREGWGARSRIIAVSGWGQPQDVQRSMQAGFDEHVVKPIERTTIDRVLDSLVHT